jgi:hypothetical protein
LFIKHLVQEEGLEPTRLSALDPKSSASANSATLAQISKANQKFLHEKKIDFYLYRPAFAQGFGGQLSLC